MTTIRRRLALGLALLATAVTPALAQDTSGDAMQRQDKAGGKSAQVPTPSFTAA